jgi:hypothetical protein
MTIGFDGWLDDELRRGFASFDAAPLPAGAPYRSRRQASPRQWFAARVATRTVVVVVVVVLGLMATSALAATAATGTTDPQVWTRHILKAINACPPQVVVGPGGIGSCAEGIVHSDYPKSPQQQSHGKSGQALPAPTPDALPGGRPNDGKKGDPSPTPAGHDSNVPHGRPTNIPNGPPSGVPVGRPSDVPAGPTNGHGKPSGAPPHR